MGFSISKKDLDGQFRLLSIVFLLIYTLAILQDYIFSKIKSTGFYLSESAIFNVFWILFIPGLVLVLLSKGHLIVRLALCIAHVFLFTSIFVIISNLLYETPHRFIAIFKTVLSGHSYWLLIIYLISPIFINFKEAATTSKVNFLILKKGKERHKVLLQEIQYIQSDKPYVKILTRQGYFYDSRSIKKLSDLLSDEGFVQLSRSTLLNKDYFSYAISRGNGDYDLHTNGGDVLRCSRHFREQWQELL